MRGLVLLAAVAPHALKRAQVLASQLSIASPMSRIGESSERPGGAGMTSPSVSAANRKGGTPEDKKLLQGTPPSATCHRVAEADAVTAVGGGVQSEQVLMRRTLVAQKKKIQQLTAKVDAVESEREAMRRQVGLPPKSGRHVVTPRWYVDV